MIKFNIGDKEYEMVNTYDEITLQQLIDMKNLAAPKNDNDLLAYGEFIKLFSGITNEELEQMDMPTAQMLIDSLVTLNDPSMKDIDDEPTIDINGTIYVISKNANDFDKLTMGEVISINVLRDTSLNKGYNTFEYLPKMLAILVRPGYKKENKEFGTTQWIQDKFRAEDIEPRAEVLKKYMSARSAMKVSNFFLNGKS